VSSDDSPWPREDGGSGATRTDAANAGTTAQECPTVDWTVSRDSAGMVEAASSDTHLDPALEPAPPDQDREAEACGQATLPALGIGATGSRPATQPGVEVSAAEPADPSELPPQAVDAALAAPEPADTHSPRPATVTGPGPAADADPPAAEPAAESVAPAKDATTASPPATATGPRPAAKADAPETHHIEPGGVVWISGGAHDAWTRTGGVADTTSVSDSASASPDHHVAHGEHPPGSTGHPPDSAAQADRVAVAEGVALAKEAATAPSPPPAAATTPVGPTTVQRSGDELVESGGGTAADDRPARQVGEDSAEDDVGPGLWASERAPAARTAAGDVSLADADRLRAAIEAVLLVVDTPTSAMGIAQGLGRPLAEVETGLRELQAEYDAGRRGFDLREVAAGWRLYTREELAPYVERFVLEGQQARLTQAALETLAVVAYRQPVTRSRVSAIRGVNVDGVMRTLLSRGLVEECGADPETGGGLYRTTSFFLEKMGLKSLSDLPSLAPLLPDTSQLDDVGLST
jgi:segregation and condensation protein B